MALHDVALVEDQVSADVCPESIEAGLADRLTVGGAGGGGEPLTVTVTDCWTLPPPPVQLNENVVLLASGPTD
jgi:hypothetical protein